MSQNFYNSNSSDFDQTQPSQFPVIHPPPQETSIKISHDQENDAFENNQYKLEDIQELFCKLLDDLQNIHEELAEFINSPGWNRLAVYDDDDDDVDYTIAITLKKSSVEDLVPIPSESEGIPDTMCDVHLVNNPTPLEAKDNFEIVITSNDDYSSSDDDYLYNENIDYVEALPHDSELVSFEVNLLIAEIEALKDNPTPSFEFLTKSSSTSLKSVLEETNNFDNSLLEFENFCFDLEEISSGSTTTHSDLSLSEYEAFYDAHIAEIRSGSTTTQSDISLPEYDLFIIDLSNDQFPPSDRSDFTHEEFVDELAHIISPPDPPAKPPDGNTGTLNIKMMGDVSDQKRSAECPMIINEKNIPLLDVPLFHFYPLDQFKYGGISLLHLAGSQPMLKSSYKAKASIIISIPSLVGGVADVVVEIKDAGWSISITFRFSVGLQTADDLSQSRLGFIVKMGIHG
uniref:Reverse transcriptase domain-containing protein n=1 Tax=Tanacetum cinerariifolium TaxID=118510 RepID=A0A6L2NVB5_TANCI|nr:hypothetical protein [Tanacetum cinerariifolium]